MKRNHTAAWIAIVLAAGFDLLLIRLPRRPAPTRLRWLPLGLFAAASSPTASSEEDPLSGSPPENNPSQFPATPPEPASPAPVFQTLIVLGGAGLMGLSLWFQQHSDPNRPTWLLWGLLLAGFAAFTAGAHMVDQARFPGWMDRLSASLRKGLGVQDWQLISLLFSPLVAVLAAVAAGVDVKMAQPVVAVFAWLAAIAMAIAGGWQPLDSAPRISRWAWLTVLALFLAALVIRALSLSSIPIILSGDEASAGLSSVEFIHGNTDNIFRVGWFSFPSLYYALVSFSIRLLGQTTLALRLPAALAGALTVAAAYLVGRRMFGERAGLFSALFLAAFHFHNNFSRIGLNNIWDGLWFIVVLGLLWLAWERQQRVYFLAAGLALGLSQYFYVSVRGLFLLIPAWVLAAGLLDRKRLRSALPGLLLMGVVTAVTFLPLAWFFLRFPGEFRAPMERVDITGEWLTAQVAQTGLPAWRILFNQVWLGLQAYAHLPLRSWYTPGIPLLQPVPAMFFAVGIGLLALQWRQARSLLAVLWLLAFGVMGGLSESTPAAQRYVAVAPVVALVVGFGLDGIAAQLERLWPSQKRFFGLLSLGMITVLCFSELNFYFRDYTPRSDFGGDNGMVAQRLAEYLQPKDGRWQVLLFGAGRMGYRSISSLPYLAPQITGYDMLYPWGSPENPAPTSSFQLFVFLPPGEQEELGRVMASYPEGKLIRETVRNNETLYLLYEVSPQGSGDAATYPPPAEPFPAEPGAYP